MCFFCLFTLNYLLARSRQSVLGRCFMGPTRLGPAKPFAAASVEWTSSTSHKLKAKTVSNPSVRVTRTGKPTKPLAGGHGHGRFCFLHAVCSIAQTSQLLHVHPLNNYPHRTLMYGVRARSVYVDLWSLPMPLGTLASIARAPRVCCLPCSLCVC